MSLEETPAASSQTRHPDSVSGPAITTACPGPGWVSDQRLPDQLPLARTCFLAVTQTSGTSGEAFWSMEKAKPTTHSCPHSSGGTYNFLKWCHESFSGSARPKENTEVMTAYVPARVHAAKGLQGGLHFRVCFLHFLYSPCFLDRRKGTSNCCKIDVMSFLNPAARSLSFPSSLCVTRPHPATLTLSCTAPTSLWVST